MSSLTISHASDSNPLYVLLTWFVAGGGVDASDAVSGVTYNGVALTRGGRSAVAGNTMEWWRLAAPASGTHNVVITLGASRRISAGVLNLSGWPSAIADHEFASVGHFGSPISVTIDSVGGAEVISWLGFNDPAQDVTAPSGSSALWNQEGLGGGSGSSGDQVSAASLSNAATPSVTLSWTGTVGAEYFGLAAISFVSGVGTSSGNLLSGSSHVVTGSNNLIAGDSNVVTGDNSEAHGQDGTVTATRSVLFCQDGSPHTLSDDGVVSIYADDVRFNGTSVKNAITALTSDVTATGPGSVAATIANDAVTNAKAANMAAATIKGRAVGAGTGDPTDLSGTQATAILDNFVGDSGAGGTKGLVPAPSAGDAAALKFLKSDGTWATPSGSSGATGVATVRAATTANITISTALNNGDSLDGVTLATGDRVLVKDQSSAAENGVYVVGVSPARATDFDTYNEHPGQAVTVQEGSVNADTIWICTSNQGGTLNTTAIAFARFSGEMHVIGVEVDGGTSVLTTGVKGFTPPMKFAGTIIGWSLQSTDASVTSGSCVFDVWKDVKANYPPTVADTITASAKPTLTTATYADSTSVDTWTTTTFAVDDIFGFNLDSVTSLKRVKLSLFLLAT